MPRKPTGNPTGRPKGTGPLGEDTQRLTIRLPAELYQRLEAFAEGRTFTRGTPELAGCARDLLEHALACPYKRQTENIPLLLGQDGKRQPETKPAQARDEIRQPENDSPASEVILRQTQNIPRAGEDVMRQTESRPTGIIPPASVQPTEEPEEVLAWGRAMLRKKQAPAPEIVSDTNSPDFDHSKYVLGKLCPQKHEYGTTGQSLLSLIGRACKECKNEDTRKRRKAKRQAPTRA